MLVIVLTILMFLRPEQPENVLALMLVTPLGIVIIAIPEQPANADSPMLVILFGRSKLIRLTHLLKAELPILSSPYKIGI